MPPRGRKSRRNLRSTFIGGEICESARRHDVQDDDIRHAYVNAIAWVELADDPARFLMVGPNSAGNLIELVALHVGGRAVIIHAMPLRKSTAQVLFGGEYR